MIFDFKYHIFTITAIFAALGLGILIGTSLIGDETLINEQKKIIKNIGKDIENIRGENVSLKTDINSLKKDLQSRKEMEKKFLSLFLKDKEEKMKDKKYLLFTEKKQNEKEIKEMFKKAQINVEVINNIDKIKQDSLKGKIILWNIKPEKYQSINNNQNILSDNIIYCKEPNLMGLILTFMESEMIEKK